MEQNPDGWHFVCTPEEGHMNPDTIQRLIRELAKGQFYEIIFVLLTVHRKEPFMGTLRQSMLEQMLIKEWSEKKFCKT